MNLLRLLFDFRGRITRAGFWLALAIQAIFIIGCEGLIAYYEFPALWTGGFLLFNIIQMGPGQLILLFPLSLLLFPLSLLLSLPFFFLSTIGGRLELTIFRGYELARDIGLGTANHIDIEFIVINLVCLLPLVASMTAVGIKRLHDRDKSGGWLLLCYLVPVIFYMAPRMTMAAGWALLMWPLVEFGFLPGTRASNRYGPDPLAGRLMQSG